MPLLPKDLQQRLASEFRFAADKVAEAPNLPAKLYFFSALFGETNRIMNQSWNAELALLHMVLLSAHREINGRLTGAAADLNRAVGLPERLPEALTEISRNLADLFEEETIGVPELHTLLARVAELGYTCTGNGQYLYLKGQIRI
ncbi:MAG: hypothetical protein HYY01_05615 [Chloroflexi bacterium]|nr:hypothetical protein [Chloroflexota bacterium]